MKNLIFKGLPGMTMKVARSLDYYWAFCGAGLGIIDSRGHALNENGQLWERPCADQDFRELREALMGADLPDWITVDEHQIEVDFSNLKYNLEWLKAYIAEREMGVKDTRRGVVLYRPMNTHGERWYSEDMSGAFKDVTVEVLGFTNSKLVSLSANSQNPDDAEWETLFFATAAA